MGIEPEGSREPVVAATGSGGMVVARDDDVSPEMEGCACPICLSACVAPVRWPGSCAHTFCERCCLDVLERGGHSCPLCRASLDGTVSVRDVLTRKAHLQVDDAAAAASRALSPQEYDERCAADQAAIESGVERRLQEAREGTELMLFCMGRLSLREGQHIGFCLFEPRYRLLVSRALEQDGRFGIVIDSCGFLPGARGRVVSIVFHRRRPDGCYDIVVAVGPEFTVSSSLWAVPPPNASPHAPPLMHTRTKIDTPPRALPGAGSEQAGEEGTPREGSSGGLPRMWWRAGLRGAARSPASSGYASPRERGSPPESPDLLRGRRQQGMADHPHRSSSADPHGNHDGRADRSASAPFARAGRRASSNSNAAGGAGTPTSADEDTPFDEADLVSHNSSPRTPRRTSSASAMSAVRSLRDLLVPGRARVPPRPTPLESQ